MEFKILKKRRFKVLGRSISVFNENISFDEKHQFWKKCESYHLFDRLRTMPACLNPNNLMSIDIKDKELNNLDYLVGVEVSNFNFVPMDMVVKEIPENDYARFKIDNGLDGVLKFWNDVKNKKIDLGDYEIKEGLSFELRDFSDYESYENGNIKIYIPIEKNMDDNS
jgi:predicted transcriptional regulator YdeE